MATWPAEDVNARFDEPLPTLIEPGAGRKEPQSDLTPSDLRRPPPKDIKEWLLDPSAPTDLPIPPRRAWPMRPPPSFDD